VILRISISQIGALQGVIYQEEARYDGKSATHVLVIPSPGEERRVQMLSLRLPRASVLALQSLEDAQEPESGAQVFPSLDEAVYAYKNIVAMRGAAASIQHIAGRGYIVRRASTRAGRDDRGGVYI
jgi:hypothetical protein